MCPRFAWARIHPGDLVYPTGDTELFVDMEAGANPDNRDVVCELLERDMCLCLFVDNSVVMVLTAGGQFGWSHRLHWHRAGVEQEWIDMGEV